MKISEILKKVEKRHETINEIISWANELLPEESRRTGGYLTIRDARTNQILLILACGFIPQEKISKYLHLSQEKGHRLFNFPEHNFSWESRNPANNEFGGALRGHRYIYSFSGHQEEIDETISLIIFYHLELMSTSFPHKPFATECFHRVKTQLFDRSENARKIFQLFLSRKS